jgi:hypothetical protein
LRTEDFPQRRTFSEREEKPCFRTPNGLQRRGGPFFKGFSTAEDGVVFRMILCVYIGVFRGVFGKMGSK